MDRTAPRSIYISYVWSAKTTVNVLTWNTPNQIKRAADLSDSSWVAVWEGLTADADLICLTNQPIGRLFRDLWNCEFSRRVIRARAFTWPPPLSLYGNVICLGEGHWSREICWVPQSQLPLRIQSCPKDYRCSKIWLFEKNNTKCLNATLCQYFLTWTPDIFWQVHETQLGTFSGYCNLIGIRCQYAADTCCFFMTMPWKKCNDWVFD